MSAIRDFTDALRHAMTCPDFDRTSADMRVQEALQRVVGEIVKDSAGRGGGWFEDAVRRASRPDTLRS
jgi:hypothetical protein